MSGPKEEAKPVIHEVENGLLCGVGVDILEYFDNLNWNAENEESNPTNAFIPNLQNINSRPKEDGPLKLKTQQLINDELIPFSTNCNLYKNVRVPSTQTKKIQERSIRHYYVPGVEGKNRPEYPSSSSLNYVEQKTVFGLMTRKELGLKWDAKDQELFQKFAAQIRAEEPDYQGFVKSQWTRFHVQRCLHILPSVQEFMVNLWLAKREKCLNMYPLNYKPMIEGVHLTATDPYQNHSVFEFDKEVWRRGFKPKLVWVTHKKRTDLLTNYDDLVRLKPIMTHKDINARPMCKEVQPISMDGDVQEICGNHDIDVIISSGSVKTLVCDPISEAWYLPVTVKKVFTIEGKEKKVVLVDKKLPRNYTSKHDLNLGHAKITTKWAYILNSYPEFKDPPRPPEIDPSGRKMISYDDLMASELDRIQLRKEDFEDNKKTSSESTHQSKKGTGSGDNRSRQQDMDKVIAGGEGVELSRCRSESTLRSESKSNPESAILSRPESHRSQTNSNPRSKMKKILNPCLVYNLFNLHKANEDPMLKQKEKRRLKVLVRSRCDGNLSYTRLDKYNLHEVYISSKVEFQPEYGASKLTKNELLREYVDLRLRPYSLLIRARSVGHTKEFMLQEIKTYQELSRVPGLVANDLFDPLYSVLSKLMDLPEGQYLVHHPNGLFADIMAQSDSFCGKGFNMEEYLITLHGVEPQLPPPQIDPSVLTSIHHRHKMPPAVFSPAPHHNSSVQSTKLGLQSYKIGSYLPGKALPMHEKRKMKKQSKKLKKKRASENKRLKKAKEKESQVQQGLNEAPQ